MAAPEVLSALRAIARSQRRRFQAVPQEVMEE